jgi:hypothetical protein
VKDIFMPPRIGTPPVKTPELPPEVVPARDPITCEAAGLDTRDLSVIALNTRGVRRIPLTDSDIMGANSRRKKSDKRRLNELLYKSSYSGNFTGCVGASPPRSLFEVYGPKKRAPNSRDLQSEDESRPASQELMFEGKASSNNSKIRHTSAMQLQRSTYSQIYKDHSSSAMKRASTMSPSKFVSFIKTNDSLGDPTSRSSSGAMDFTFPSAKQMREMERKMVQQCKSSHEGAEASQMPGATSSPPSEAF